MKIIPDSRKFNYASRIAIFLLTAVLISGMAGCFTPFRVQYALTISSTEGGEVTTPGEGTFSYWEGTVVNLVAVADEDYQFVNWTGNVSAIVDVNAAATNITINVHYSITANFGENLEIRDWYDLDAVRDNLSGNHTLMNDLNSTTAGYTELASPTANQGKCWEPIGRTGTPLFRGTFDGQGYEIRNLFINRPYDGVVGLFGVVARGVVKDIGVVNVTVTGVYWVGGLVGENYYGTVSDSYSTGSVIGSTYVGGLVGRNEVGTVSNSYSTGNVTGNAKVGGLVGVNYEGTVSNSYSTGNVTGEDGVGGLVGRNWGSVSNCHSTGSVTGNNDIGGLMGYSEGTVSDSFWDT
jgi:hypothetical protein